VNRAHQLRLVVLVGSLLVCSGFKSNALLAQGAPNQNLDRQFKSAVAQYHAGQYTEAAVQLESLLSHVPKSFEVHEILGLTYAALSEKEKAVEQLEIAARLKPDSEPARTNLATALAISGKSELAEAQFRRALALEPHDFDANHNLADFYLQTNRIANALPLLEQAQRINPSSYNNGYDLALAYFLKGRLDDARQLVQSMVKQKDNGELHNLLGQIEEKDGRFVQAANEFEVAAQMDPSEDNLFTWGSELMLHRTYEPAIDVFQQATRRYPSSSRLLIGLGMALYSRGRYEESIKSLLAAADLNPTDARCYLFLSKAYLSSPNQADAVIERFHRYSELQPDNALAQYYYAVSLWKGKRLEETSVDFHAVESLLQKAIALDGTLADAHLQLGILYADQHELSKSLPEYQRALELNPDLPDVHYRLGQYYVRAGKKDQAQQEFALYQKLQAQHMAAVDKERAEVQQFVYSAKPSSTTKP
jgi:tetratricopeptide (TPR) repeat protein